MANQKDFEKNATDMFISKKEEPAPEPTPAPDPEILVAPAGYELVRKVKNTRLQLLVREDTKEFLRQRAFDMRISINELANQALEEYMRNHK